MGVFDATAACVEVGDGLGARVGSEAGLGVTEGVSDVITVGRSVGVERGSVRLVSVGTMAVVGIPPEHERTIQRKTRLIPGGALPI